MIGRWAILVLLGCPPLLAEPFAFERDVLKELNKVRENPASIVPRLEKLFTQFEGKFLFVGPTLRIQTQEGGAAVREAIESVKKRKPGKAFTYSPTLTQAARDMQKAQERSGEIGHYNAGKGPSERAQKHTKLVGKSGENITYGSYGGEDAQAVVVAMIVDDGVPDRGHRRNVFDPRFKRVGIACGKHPKFQTMCVFDFAEGERKRD